MVVGRPNHQLFANAIYLTNFSFLRKKNLQLTERQPKKP